MCGRVFEEVRRGAKGFVWWGSTTGMFEVRNEYDGRCYDTLACCCGGLTEKIETCNEEEERRKNLLLLRCGSIFYHS